MIVPCFNEADVLRQRHQRLLETLDSDRTIEDEIVTNHEQDPMIRMVFRTKMRTILLCA